VIPRIPMLSAPALVFAWLGGTSSCERAKTMGDTASN
jgi:hypothetical protein